jgi:hypothetical protein
MRWSACGVTRCSTVYSGRITHIMFNNNAANRGLTLLGGTAERHYVERQGRCI